MRDPEGEGWLMVFPVRVPGLAKPDAGGFGQFDVLRVFEHQGRWSRLFRTSAPPWSTSPTTRSRR